MAFGYGDGGGGPTRNAGEHPRNVCLPGYAADAPGPGRRVLPQTRGDIRRPSAHLERSCTWSCTAAPIRRKAAISGPTARANSCCTTPSSPHLWPRWSRRLCLPQRGARPGMGAGVPQPVPRHHPRSSINLVYVESQEQYAEIRSLGEQVRDQALAAIGAQMDADALLVNPTGFARSDLAFLPGEWDASSGLQTAAGASVAVQPTADGAWIDGGELPPYSVTPLKLDALPRPADRAARLARPALKTTCCAPDFNGDGDITHLRQGSRELLPPGALANQFQAFEDRPLNWTPGMWTSSTTTRWTANLAQSVRRRRARPAARHAGNPPPLHSDYVQHVSLAHNSLHRTSTRPSTGASVTSCSKSPSRWMC